MASNPITFIAAAGDLSLPDDELESTAIPGAEPLDLDKLPQGVVSGTTLIDFSNVASAPVRAGVSLAMLFASRLATKATPASADEDQWLAAYTSNLSALGFALSGSGIVSSRFKKTGLKVHEAIIPFLTMAFGGAAVGPIILAGLKNLKDMDKGSPWITLFDRESRRFNLTEMHFAAVSSDATETHIRYAIARLSVASDTTQILFFKITDATASFESSTTTMTANNSLLAVMEPDLRLKLGEMTRSFILDAKL